MIRGIYNEANIKELIVFIPACQIILYKYQTFAQQHRDVIFSKKSLHDLNNYFICAVLALCYQHIEMVKTFEYHVVKFAQIFNVEYHASCRSYLDEVTIAKAIIFFSSCFRSQVIIQNTEKLVYSEQMHCMILVVMGPDHPLD